MHQHMPNGSIRNWSYKGLNFHKFDLKTLVLLYMHEVQQTSDKNKFNETVKIRTLNNTIIVERDLKR